MAQKSEKWTEIVEEMLSLKPRLSVVQTQMRSLGVEPGSSLLECMELALNRLEPQIKEKILKRSKLNEL